MVTRPRDPLESPPRAYSVTGSASPDACTEALVEWVEVGLELFVRQGSQLPSWRAVDEAAQRVILAAALHRWDSISAVARALGMSRRAVRDAMRRLDLYEQWQARS